MGSLFFAMAGLQTVGEIMLYVGLVLVLGSTTRYVREGLRLRARQRSANPPSSST
jgi:hypothetical protein